MAVALLIITVACLPQLIHSSNLALTFDANNSTCTAACTTCDSDKSSSVGTGSTDTVTAALLEELLNTTRINALNIKSTQERMVTSLTHLRNTSTSNAGAINDILLLVEDLLELHNGSSFSPLPTSCEEINKKQPNSPSGVYLLATSKSDTKYVYCNMRELCGSGGGWTRLAYLDMTDATENCPSGFKLYQSGGVRACGRPTSSGGSCQSVQFPSNGTVTLKCVVG